VRQRQYDEEGTENENISIVSTLLLAVVVSTGAQAAENRFSVPKSGSNADTSMVNHMMSAARSTTRTCPQGSCNITQKTAIVRSFCYRFLAITARLLTAQPFSLPV
jgi:hypothetical protein